MIEVEVKIKLKDLNEFKKKLLELGVKRLGEWFEEDIYFKHPSVDFKATDEALRLRRVDGKINLTYKGPKISSNSKTREEIDVEVVDFNTVRLLFEKLRFQVLTRVAKKREVYLFEEIKISLDKVEDLGDFAEFEILIEYERHVKEAEEKVFNLLRRLGFNKSNSVTLSYLELILHKINSN